jgi:phytoene dehydrogenase-like protein
LSKRVYVALTATDVVFGSTTISNYRMPLKGLYLVGAGAHPGGGVMGAAGRNGARVVLGDLGIHV